jgi:hypothetical protein
LTSDSNKKSSGCSASSALLFQKACLLLILTATAYAKQGPCGAEQANYAKAEAPTLHDWNSLNKSYTEYDNCDDGPVAAAYSQTVSRILIDHWETLPQLDALAKTNPDFGAFVLKHVDKTLSAGDIKQIAANAKTRCPQGLSGICEDLKKQAH